MVALYFAGGEDSDYVNIGACTVDTTAGRFRSTYARCGLSIPSGAGKFWSAIPGVGGHSGWSSAISQFWFSSRGFTGNVQSSATDILRFADAGGVTRIRISPISSTQFAVFKQSAALVATQLGPNTNGGTAGFLNNSPAIADKLDVFVNYAVSGTITVYLNGIILFTFSGDLTTDANTALQGHQYGAAVTSGATTMVWSEGIVSDSDTRSWSLQTLAPVANGNTHNFDVGSPAAANVNEITLSDATFDGASSNGLIDQYTVPALAAGSYSILAVGVSTRAQEGFSGPSKMDNGVRSSATDTWSADHSLVTAFANYQDWWTTDPATAVSWTALPTNIGLRSVT